MRRRVKLKDVCLDITVGHVGPMADEYVDVGIPFLRSQNILPFRLDRSNLKFITEAFHRKLKKSALSPGDVAVVRTGYPGTACVIPKGLPVANCADLVVIRPSEELDSYYLCCLFNSAWGRSTVAGSLVGVAQQHFNIGVAREMEVTLPPVEVQRRIASILSAYDDLIENNTRRIKILEEMAQMVYREWFVNFRFPGHENVKMVESEVGPIPEEWQVTTLGRILTLEYGKALKEADRHGGPVPVYGSSGVVGQHSEKLTSGPGIIVGRKGNVGSVFFCHPDFWVIDTAYYVRSDVSLYFLYFNLLSQNFLNNDAAVPGLNRNQAHSLPVVLPPDVGVLESFERVVMPMFNLKRSLQLRNTNLRTTRDFLLPKLISGEVSVETTEDAMLEAVG